VRGFEAKVGAELAGFKMHRPTESYSIGFTLRNCDLNFKRTIAQKSKRAPALNF